MADITWSHVTQGASDLSAVATNEQTDILAYVNALAPDKFGGESAPRYKLARIMLARHFGQVSLTKGSPPAGPVISETEGDLSRSYGFPQIMSTVDLMATGWGREYAQLVRRSGAARAPLVT